MVGFLLGEKQTKKQNKKNPPNKQSPSIALAAAYIKPNVKYKFSYFFTSGKKNHCCWISREDEDLHF